MNSIIYVGMDVHTTNYTLCCFSPDKDKVFAIAQVEPDYIYILKYLKRVEKNIGKPCRFLCGYEAGCLGYSLYHQLTDNKVECVILAPTTMMRSTKEIKTDRRDAEKIAKCLAFNTYKPVYVPTEEDNAVKEYIRMRDDAKASAKRYKQQILSFCVRHGKCFDGKGHWTKKHLAWLASLDFGNALLQETFQEYLRLLDQTLESLKRFENKINELANSECYAERTRKLNCFLGIANVIALAVLAEVGDFNRFSTASQFASYLGLVPGEYSSGDKRCRSGITKAGNSHIRKLLTEAAQCYSRGKTGAKSVTLKRKQAGNSPDIIAYDNMILEMNVIHAAWQNGCKKLEFLGSSCIYPRMAPQPMKESCLLTSELEKTNEAYALAKISGLKYCEFLNRQYGTDYISVMPTNLYGPNDNYHPTHSHVLPALIRRFHEAKVSGAESVTCWGDGSPLREFLYVDDLANLCVFLMNNYSGNETVNAGTGKELTIKELTELVAKVVGYTGKIEWDTSKPNGTPRKLLDVSKATNLGWTYKTELEEGIRLSYEDFLNNPMRAER